MQSIGRGNVGFDGCGQNLSLCQIWACSCSTIERPRAADFRAVCPVPAQCLPSLRRACTSKKKSRVELPIGLPLVEQNSRGA